MENAPEKVGEMTDEELHNYRDLQSQQTQIAQRLLAMETEKAQLIAANLRLQETATSTFSGIRERLEIDPEKRVLFSANGDVLISEV